jgi:hypothetical protein
VAKALNLDILPPTSIGQSIQNPNDLIVPGALVTQCVKNGRPVSSKFSKSGYHCAAVPETLKCPNCEADIEPAARKCGKCEYYLKSELECLRSIDRLVGIIERILIWWLVVSFMGAVVYIVSRFK